MTYDHSGALELLRLGTRKLSATFHEGQAQAIQQVAEGRGRLLVVQRTGWGKSFVYFIVDLTRERARVSPRGGVNRQC